MIPEMCHFSMFHLWCPIIYGESQKEGGVKFHNGTDLGQEINYWTFLWIVLSLSSKTSYYNEDFCLS